MRIGDIVIIRSISDSLPAIVTRVIDNDTLNLVVFTDGTNSPPFAAVHYVEARRGGGIGEWLPSGN